MSIADPSAAGRIARPIRSVLHPLAALAQQVAPPLLRIALALPFLHSGLTRWDDTLSISEGTLYLFEEQFKLHILGAAYDLPAPDLLARVTAVAEIVLPVLLLLGLATRFAALALLVMTGVIQLIFPDGWANFHLNWAAMAVALMAVGPGRLSVDHWIGRRCRGFGPGPAPSLPRGERG